MQHGQSLSSKNKGQIDLHWSVNVIGNPLPSVFDFIINHLTLINRQIYVSYLFNFIFESQDSSVDHLPDLQCLPLQVHSNATYAPANFKR